MRWLDENGRIATELGEDLEQNETIQDEFTTFMSQFNETGEEFKYLLFMKYLSLSLDAVQHHDVTENRVNLIFYLQQFKHLSVYSFVQRKIYL